MVQAPTATSVTVFPATVQTVKVVDAKLTGKPEEAVALTVNGAVPNTRFASAPKVMVWVACVTWKLWLTGVAAPYVVLPACVAWMVQVPTATRVTVETETVQMLDVSEAKLTGRPEEALAETVNGALPSVLFESVPKVMVCAVCVTVNAFTQTLLVESPAVASVQEVPSEL
jgi:hypothetical protein